MKLSMVSFPDVERAEWLNKMIDQVWPYIGDYVQDLLKTTVESKIQQSSPSVSSFKFVTIDLGDIPPRIGGVKVYTENVRRDEIYMDLDIIYASDCNIIVSIKGVRAGIKDLQLHGTLRVVFKPLLSKMPLFGSISVFFLNSPEINFNLTELANALDLPGLNDMLYTIIKEQIANIMVLPNRIVVPIFPEMDVSKLRYPQPAGVLRLHVIEAKDLIKADVSVLGKGKSDPYAVIKVGAQKFKTKVIQNTVTPRWDAVFELIINEKDGQFMDIKLKDEDPGNKDDPLGNVNIEISPVAEKGTVESWLPLENVKKGLLHVKLVWLHLSKDPQELEKICEQMKGDKKQEELSSCVLMIHLDSAKDLPRSKKLSEPSPYGMISISQNRFESNVCNDTCEPRWEQSFRCLIHDPHFEMLDLKDMGVMLFFGLNKNMGEIHFFGHNQDMGVMHFFGLNQDMEAMHFFGHNQDMEEIHLFGLNQDIGVMDKKSDKSLGELSFPLKNLLAAPDLVLDQQFQLRKSETNSQVHLRLALRVLTTEKTSDWQEESENLLTKGAEGTTEDVSERESPDDQISAVAAEVEKNSTPGMNAKASQENNVTSSTTPVGQNDVKPVTKPIPPASPSQDEGDSVVRQRKSTTPSSGSEFGRGRIQLTLRYSSQRERMIVVVHKCQGLPAMDRDHFSDPYVKLYLLPDKSTKGKRKTKVIKDNLDPIYDETFEFQVPPGEINSRSLEVTVNNDNTFKQDLIGMIVIDLKNLDVTKALTEWFDLRPESKGQRPVSIETDKNWEVCQVQGVVAVKVSQVQRVVAVKVSQVQGVVAVKGSRVQGVVAVKVSQAQGVVAVKMSQVQGVVAVKMSQVQRVVAVKGSQVQGVVAVKVSQVQDVVLCIQEIKGLSKGVRCRLLSYCIQDVEGYLRESGSGCCLIAYRKWKAFKWNQVQVAVLLHT
ncbi:hypothetical protein CHS0354_005316 [Potamilus streckersoni]|uniref:Uncharacterized protein n=1 Tax=Potamilus streckersoni TaxID=2493646 RepID=A0AAE0SGS1_9BIVA|nr:hypothetical protein CHS0354_005316 [Potamilus streckersoni]